MVRGLLSVALLASAMLFGIDALTADKPLIPAGSTLRIRLDTTLTDKTNNAGDSFGGEVTEPILVDGKEVVPKYSTVNGHVAFVKPSGRVYGRAQMRVVIDSITTPDDLVYPLSSTLEGVQGGVCGETRIAGRGRTDEEGTITGCGKSKKQTAKGAAIAGAIGAVAGASVGMAGRGGCDYYGNCYPRSGPAVGAGIGYGTGIGVGTVLIYSLLKHEKHIVLVEGTELTFTVNRTTTASPSSAAQPANPLVRQ